MGVRVAREKAERIMGGEGKAARKQARKGVKLKTVVIAARTLKRYERAVLQFYAFLAAMGNSVSKRQVRFGHDDEQLHRELVA